ncbi:1-acylglycerol-3-phosphate O-acyltransferase 6 (lysophosphatidic acid acyltransferase, zeta) [Borealophlyctis nickersoniae]|nr:1-acylglycerol-3-phosphate O-acyltransferase 6 (lysophosphatidic acid acyltransferase, zeta) [Borealophlyctis nickersoniae]
MPPNATSDSYTDRRSSSPYGEPRLRRVRSAKSLAPRDVLPGFEQKLDLHQGTLGASNASVLKDGLAFIGFGAQAIAQDEFSKCFTQKPRTRFSLKTIMLGPLHHIGWFFRYFFMFPYRLTLLLIATAFFFLLLPVVLYFENEAWQRWLFRFYCGAFLRSWGSKIRYHGVKPKLDEPHIFVANHTSFIDYILLSAHDFPHATVAQTHKGIIGYFEHSVLTLNGSLMFNRNEKNDRTILAQKMRAHVQNATKSPLLIFPEGTCVNNEYTVLFHKGSFELDAQVCPVAIKYDKRYADAYWHTKTQTFTKHLLYLMTRWALVADVWYLPPRPRKEGQSAAEFANEVKAEISVVAGLKNLNWDGYFKNYAPQKEKQQRLQEHPQTRYGAVLMNRIRNRAMPDRMKGLRRSASIHFGAEASIRPFRDHLISRPEWIDPKRSTNIKNEILRAIEDEDRSADMITEISHRKNDVVQAWKRYTKNRTADDNQRRLENSTWRLWFKRRIEREMREAAEEERRQSRMAAARSLSAYNLMSVFALSSTPPLETRKAAGMTHRRQRSKSADADGPRNRLFGGGMTSLRRTPGVPSTSGAGRQAFPALIPAN